MRVAPACEVSKAGPSPATAGGKPRVGRHWRLWIILIRYARAVIFLINIRTLALAFLACLMVYFCESTVLDLRFKMEFSIVSVGTVFPLVFSIQQAFQRREEALRQLAILKGQLMGMYFSHRDWDVSDGIKVRANLGNDEAPHAVRTAELITRLLSLLRRWLSGRTAFESEAEWRMLYGTTGLRREITHQLSGDFFRGEEIHHDSGSDSDGGSGRKSMRKGKGGGRSGSGSGSGSGKGGGGGVGGVATSAAMEAAEQDPHWQLYFQLYDVISEMSVHNEELTVLAGCAKAGEAGMSRLAAYLTKTVELLERLRSLREYRTPSLLRYVSFVLVLASIFLAAPYFAFMCNDTKYWSDDTSGRCPAGYFTAVIYVMVVSMLFHVQVALENPFDGIGMDDVFVNMDREFAVTVRRYVRSRAAAKEAAEAAAAAAMEADAEGEGGAAGKPPADGNGGSGGGEQARRDSGVKALSILVEAGEGDAAKGFANGGEAGGGGSRASAAAAATHVYGAGGGVGSNRPGSGRSRSGHSGAALPGTGRPREPSPAWGSIKVFQG